MKELKKEKKEKERNIISPEILFPIKEKTCPYFEICQTPQWYAPRYIKIENEVEISFVEEVCKTEKHKECIHYESLKANPDLYPGSEAWELQRKAIQSHWLYKKREKSFNPSQRRN